MALINCPECNRRGVSSTAKACPSCGFDVSSDSSAYFRFVVAEEKQRKEDRQKREQIDSWRRERLCVNCGGEGFVKKEPTITAYNNSPSWRCSKCNWTR